MDEKDSPPAYSATDSPSNPSPSAPPLALASEGAGISNPQAVTFSAPPEIAPPSYGSQPDAPPPSYDSVFGKVQKIKDESEGAMDCCKKFAELVCSSIACILLLGLSLGVPVAMIYVGVIKLHMCVTQDMVPLFLLVGGAVWCGYCLILVLRRTVHKCRKRRRAQANGNETGDVPPVSPAAGGDDDAEEATHPAMKAFDTLVSSFCFGWFIAGNYYTYTTWKKKDCPIYACDPQTFCDPTVLLFSFWLLNSIYICCGFATCCICCVGGIMGAKS